MLQKYTRVVCSLVLFLMVFVVQVTALIFSPATLEYITVSNGLPQNTVRCIEKDFYGFMWFGTDNGLCRYDGYDFVYYTTSKESGTLNDDRILDIKSGKNHLLWLTTPKGVQIFNALTNKFEVIFDQNVKELFNSKILHLEVSEKSIWVVSQNNGVYELNNNNKVGNIRIKKQYFNNDLNIKASYVEIGKDNQVYVGTNNGVYVFDDATSTFVKLDSKNTEFKNVAVQTIYSTDSEMWVGTEEGLYVLNSRTKQVRHYVYAPLDATTIPHNSITSIVESVEGQILIGTLGGLCVYNDEKDSFQEIELFPSSLNKDHDVFISSLYTDDIGNVWVGTEKTGLVHFYTFTKKFKALPESERFKNFNHNIINAILYSKNNLWIGTAGEGLVRYDQNNDMVIRYKTELNNDNAIESNFVTYILEDKNSEYWIGTWGMGVQKLLDINSENFISYHTEQGLPNENIACFYKCKNGTLVVGTQGGLAIYNPIKDVFVPIELTCRNKEDAWQVGSIQEDNEGFLWIGTTNGLFRFKSDLINYKREIQLSVYDIIAFEESNDLGTLPNNYTTCIDLDKEGNIWIGTYGKGIAKAVPEINGTFSFQNFTEKDGLANNVVYKIISDKNNDLWITTENGLSRFNLDSLRFINYYSKDGLRNDQYYWSAGYKANNDYIYFGGLNGLNYFHPDSIENYPYSSKTYITKLKVYNSDVTAGQKLHGIMPLKKATFNTDSIQLSYKDNVFSIEFSALPYYLSSKVKYAYLLEGVDKDWVYVDADRRIASYTNLNGGAYTFKVKSTDLDGQWIGEPTEVLIRVEPPIWKTKWFQFLLILLLAILISAYIRYRSFRISQQKKRLEQIVKQRTLEIKEKNDQLEKNALTLRANNKQLAARQEEIEEQKTQLEIQKSQLEQQNGEIISQRDQLIALNKEVESIHQMRMQFFTNISHEFRTPLTLIISPIERILSNNFSFTKDNVVNAVKYIKRNAERLLMLTNEITTFRKYEADKVKITLTHGNVGEFISEIADSFRELAESNKIKFNVSIDYNLEDTWYDISKLENILFNLISNAIKYTKEGGVVSIWVTKIKNEFNKSQLLINIQDNGIGIDKEKQDKVFERFYRDTSNESNTTYGTGIGLSLTKQMIEVLNGSISLDSEINKGSSFKVILPIEEADFPEHEIQTGERSDQILLKERIELLKDPKGSEQTFLKEEVEDNLDEAKPRLLVVDDNSDLREFLAESLSGTYHVQTAIDGEVGYKMALEKDFDLIVSDVMMPKVSGLEMCKQLKNNIHTSHIPVILLTAKGQEEDFVEGLEYGADDYISKPFNLNVLQAKISSLIENRKKLAQRYQQMEHKEDQAEIKTNSLDDDFMNKLNQVISENYTNPAFDIETFSSKMFMSRSLLYKKLKALTNVSPTEYVNMYRLKKSVVLLKSKKHQVSEVAFMVGFNDPKYFGRVFKKFFNTSPSSYVD
ncbi:two-component regulator propeller domain-containing protein [Plebeiibacterium sediminum]|uniref:histidine kinase n=1 Tax=Plebeiibacterium sediminum TaxID=2992112 RepID=A0AAE3M4R7_9BACT|nr:two-component regulator propeller domain-containing protein [Plebeiobacterium sediminum]MCW3786800.1 response regulator [Plebeiobacterium sediminum]